MDDETNHDDNIVQLNVGGCLYTTSRSTLTLYPGSMLATMITGQLPSSRDASGAYIIDRDGPTFRYVLNFLRQGELKLPADYKDLSLLSVEADFYQIEQLIVAVAATVKANDESNVNLNVGGCLYTTTRSTLTRYPDSMLGQMFSGRIPSTRNFNGAHVIDGDGPTFRYVLNFLRRGRLILPEDFKEWDLLASEVDFYQIKELNDAVVALRAMMRQKDEIEVIELSVHNRIYKYKGSQNTLEQIPQLLEFFVDLPYTSAEKILNRVKQTGLYETSVRRYTEPFSFEQIFGRQSTDIYKQITQIGFALRSPPFGFQRKQQDELNYIFARKR